MRPKLVFLLLFIALNFGNSQQFSIENLQTNEQIEVALDSAFVWTENGQIKKTFQISESLKTLYV